MAGQTTNKHHMIQPKKVNHRIIAKIKWIKIYSSLGIRIRTGQKNKNNNNKLNRIKPICRIKKKLKKKKCYL